MTKRWIPLLFALGAAAIVNALALAAINPLIGEHTLRAILITFGAYLPLSVLGTVVFGIPALAVIVLRHQIRTFKIVLVGIGCGELAAAVICYTTVFDWHWFALLGASSVVGTLASLPFVRAGVQDYSAGVENIVDECV